MLNLNFPSQVASTETDHGAEPYGYSSGTYAKFNPSLGLARLIPTQEDIDALGGGITRKDWENRFELVYTKTREANVKSVIGVTPVRLAFARYLHRRHNVKPRDLWRFTGLYCTSVAKIQTHYKPILEHYYGEVPLRELYSATEGVFAQQLDNHPYVSPNYDIYLFEVKTRSGVKLLHELAAGEWGRVVISTVMFPRYDIGDLIESAGKNYFRIFGRAKPLTVMEHLLFNLIAGRVF